MCPEVCAEVYVSGRVQGVYFRQFTMDTATGLGLKGFAQNLSDGRVKVIAQGERSFVEKLLDKLRIGPALANVDGLDVKWIEPSGDLVDFYIKR